MVKEEFRVVDRNRKYKVSNYGNVIGVKGRLLKKCLNAYGYPKVSLWDSITNTKEEVTIHILVAEAFLYKKQGMTVNHKDGNKQNNYYGNLEYMTSIDNIKHAFENGLSDTKGEKNPNAILKEKDVKRIVNYRNIGLSVKNISRLHRVSNYCIYDIIEGRSWTHITGL